MKSFSLLKTAAVCTAIIVSATWFVSAGPPSLTPPPGPITESGRFGTRCDVLSLSGHSDSLHVIDQPGSYYLSGNINGQAQMHGIKILAHDVTLDLNGFHLIGAVDSLNGIYMPLLRQNVVIKNGGIRNWGSSGMDLTIDAGRVEGVSSSRNAGWGIRNTSLAYSSKILNCEVWQNGDPTDTTVGGGIQTHGSVMIRDCLAHQNHGDGFSALQRASFFNCVATLNAEDGIQYNHGCLVRGCLATGNSATQYNGFGPGSVLVDNK